MLIRDIQQLRDTPPFAYTAVQGLLTLEKTLHDALRYVPCCDEHNKVWSPVFASIIIDAASQVDSVWKASTRHANPNTNSDRLTIVDHFGAWGQFVAREQVVFFGGQSPRLVSPFAAWQQGFSVPDWWAAYNELKHDRFTHQDRGTLEAAIDATAALLLAIVYSGNCDLALTSARLLDESSGHNPWAFTETGLLRDVTSDGLTKIETALFAHPIGVFVGGSNWGHWESDSVRFTAWWALNGRAFFRPRPTAPPAAPP